MRCNFLGISIPLADCFASVNTKQFLSKLDAGRECDRRRQGFQNINPEFALYHYALVLARYMLGLDSITTALFFVLRFSQIISTYHRFVAHTQSSYSQKPTLSAADAVRAFAANTLKRKAPFDLRTVPSSVLTSKDYAGTFHGRGLVFRVHAGFRFEPIPAIPPRTVVLTCHLFPKALPEMVFFLAQMADFLQPVVLFCDFDTRSTSRNIPTPQTTRKVGHRPSCGGIAEDVLSLDLILCDFVPPLRQGVRVWKHYRHTLPCRTACFTQKFYSSFVRSK